MSTSSSGKTVSGAVRRRAALILSGVLLAIVACGAMASSAFALSWWVETPPQKELTLGTKLFLGSEAKVQQAFTLKWKKKFEVSCGEEVKYNNLYIEGHLGIGAEGGIDFAKCKAKKPKGTVLIGEKIETLPVAGNVTQSGSEYKFTLAPKVAALVAAFQLERTVKPRKHYKAAKNKLCTYNVEALGELGGKLGDNPEKIGTEKTLEFASQNITMKSTKECETVMMAAKPSAKPLAASGLTLKTKDGGPLKPGQQIEADSHNLVFSAGAEVVDCNENTFAGTLTNNNGKTDTATINEAESEGAGVIGECLSSTPPNEVGVTWQGLPWAMGIGAKGSGAVKGAPVAVTLESFETGLACKYEAPGIKFTNTISGPVTITVPPSPFPLSKGASQTEHETCPAQGTVSGTFQVASEGEPVEGEPFVSEKEHQEEKEEVAEEEAEEAEEAAGLPLEGNKGKLGYSGTSGWGLL